MNSFLDEPADPWNHFVSVLATDESVPEKARPHLARWVSRWRHAVQAPASMITYQTVRSAVRLRFLGSLRPLYSRPPVVLFVSFVVYLAPLPPKTLGTDRIQTDFTTKSTKGHEEWNLISFQTV